MKARKKAVAAWWAASLLLPLIITVASGSAHAAECGEMHIVSVGAPEGGYTASPCVPKINGAWTTNDPFGNPWAEVHDFTIGYDTLALVVNYEHCGGYLPLQHMRAYSCDSTKRVLKICDYDWTLGLLPQGQYLLIYYYEPVLFNSVTFDWAVKIGDLIFGYPFQRFVPPECVTLHHNGS